mmetsp:Transcript_181/g.526  ORF Transcript_181/g.526 Transcript_181/m.526 type:complete len:322 (+) Transcript_181:92-1057(+)
MTIQDNHANSMELYKTDDSIDVGAPIDASEPNQTSEPNNANVNANVNADVNDDGNDDGNANINGENSVLAERERKIEHWKDSDFAVGCVNISWEDDQPSWWCFNPKKNRKDSTINQQFPISAIVCGCLRAGRVGNMSVLAQTTEDFEEEIVDPESGQVTINRKKRPKLLWVCGPYWTVNLGITFPLIFGVSCWMGYTRVIESGLAIIITWSIGTFLMIFSLCMISCRNPGILHRYSQIPANNTEEDWRWNDQARTYRPASSRFDTECQVVVEGFDHTCPWTGTAIGSANMFWFRIFVSMVVVMLLYTVMLATLGGFLRSFF